MLKTPVYRNRAHVGFTLLEVLIAILITAFGLLGLAGLMSRMQVAGTEGFQRAQAMSLLTDMTERINAAVPGDVPTGAHPAVAYRTGSTGVNAPLGTGVTDLPNCTAATTMALRDRCEWSKELKGAAETSGGGTSIGGMIGARGCVELVVPPNPALGTCIPATFRVTVAWQGLVQTNAPDAGTACGSGSYGAETQGMRRVIAQQITIGLPDCTP